MPVTRVQVTIPYTSGLPEDVMVNTFHVITGASQMTVPEIVGANTAFVAFYNTPFGGAGTDVAGWMSSLLSRVAAVSRIEYFALDDPEPRLPYSFHPWTLGPADSSGIMPPEVALCGSFQADPISGVNQARRRGRIFLGPLINTAVDTTTGRPNNATINDLRSQMDGLLNNLTINGTPWAVYSRVGNAAAQVTNGWVDNEFDTQRRRGRRATTRTTFS